MISCPACRALGPVDTIMGRCLCGRLMVLPDEGSAIWLFRSDPRQTTTSGLTFSRDQLKEWDDGLRCFVFCPDPSEAVSRHASAALAQEVLES